ncbi:GDSL-type esterase/lipase family protein [Amycolatopsis umgeniensis]|uniref:Lysophospholipase L1-like esterase n=1 Tax=Amycolatopsis umgeniensis TaxID=336628 RepID=A0A841B640_9PSEU|nr:GDSL-type esterase/lipase family protein [Amycolatopsis umgeniensis]MBB5855546.1 lysophospholipase L1-like esterase [Amycolatopsis umgeniensis]
MRRVLVLALMGTLLVGAVTPASAAPTPFAGLSAFFDNAGSSNLDGFGHGLSAEALSLRGVSPGALISSHGTRFTWPTASPGARDNATAQGQTVGVPGSSDRLGFLVTATGGRSVSGTGTITYTDGTTRPYRIGSPDWAAPVPSGVAPAISMPYRNGPGGKDVRQVNVYHADVAIDPQRTVHRVRLPDAPALHVFAVALAGRPNLALGALARQSSDAFGSPASRAVDGDTNGVYANNSITHTGSDRHAWWQADLGGAAAIDTLELWNRTDCCAERLTGFRVFVSPEPLDPAVPPEEQAKRPGVWSSHHSGPAGALTILKPGTTGRYVLVQLDGTGNLSLAELRVFGRAQAETGWVGTWGTSQAGPASAGYAGYSIRNVVHTSVGGNRARVTFSNKFGTAPLTLGAATVASRGSGETADAVPGSVRRLTFAGQPTVTVPAGDDVTSDPLDFAVPEDADLLVTTYTPDSPGVATHHPSASQTSFLAQGDVSAAESGARFTERTGSWFYVEEIDVQGAPAAGSVVAFGDSITDGGYSTSGANHRWPDYLADRMKVLPAAQRRGVLNSGVSANRLLLDGGDVPILRSGLSRLDDDVLDRTGVRTAIVLMGINDLLQTPRQNDPAALAAGYRNLVDRLHAKGIKVIGATLTPFKGWWGHDSGLEATRTGVNELIRSGGIFDGVADFDAAVRDPADPSAMRPEFAAEDKLHPSDAGNEALAAAIELAGL